MSFVYWAMVVTSDFGSESPGSSPGSPTKRDNLMKAWSNPYVDSSTLGVPYMWDGIPLAVFLGILGIFKLIDD